MSVRNTGQEFVKKIRPVGAAAFFALFILSTALMFMLARDPLDGYSPPEDAGYYKNGGDAIYELLAELEANVFPFLEGVGECAVIGGRLRISIVEPGYYKSRAAILRHYDPELFEFVMEEGS